MLLRRLPRLRDDRVAPEAAFAGTFHINETMSQLDAAFATALRAAASRTRCRPRSTATR